MLGRRLRCRSLVRGHSHDGGACCLIIYSWIFGCPLGLTKGPLFSVLYCSPEKEVLSSKELGHAPHPLRLGTPEKQGIVLAREQELLAVASQLRRVQELTKYISGPFLEGGRSVHSNPVPVPSISDNVQ